MAGRRKDDPEVVRNGEGPGRGLLVAGIVWWEFGLGNRAKSLQKLVRVAGVGCERNAELSPIFRSKNILAIFT